MQCAKCKTNFYHLYECDCCGRKCCMICNNSLMVDGKYMRICEDCYKDAIDEVKSEALKEIAGLS